MVVYSIFWAQFIYNSLCHWGGTRGARLVVFRGDDAIAGGRWISPVARVVHISRRHLGLVSRVVDRPRNGFPQEPLQPQQPDVHGPWGSDVRWVGWFGFNAGSELLSTNG